MHQAIGLKLTIIGLSLLAIVLLKLPIHWMRWVALVFFSVALLLTLALLVGWVEKFVRKR